ncbi:MAG TPA: hypothetical protein VGS03_04510 [Candidatus Polarisedimenticolia bacterium]|jgi:hypothetical protein|nr:hypothetical protein [Candidatus Polarisedimenticolia bacterium]
MRRVAAAIAVGLLVLAPATALARGTMTPVFRNVKTRPMSVAVLPAHSEFIQGRVVVTAQREDDCAALEREAAVAVRTNLEMLGYQVRLLTRQDLEKDAGLRDLVGRVDGRFVDQWKGLVRNPESLKQGSVGAGDDAVRLAALLRVDGLALTRVVAVAPPQEKRAAQGEEAAKGAGQSSYGRVDIGILDGKAGRIEAFFTGLQAGSFSQLTGRPAKVMGRATEEAFSFYPASTEPGRARKDLSLPASEKGSRGMLPPSEEAALRDFEVLLKGTPTTREAAAR